jgi:predicted amidohydrolase
MHWAIDENLREVEAALQLAADRGAELVLFLICREILDEAELAEELAGRAQAIPWPGMMARPRGDAAVRATALARQQGAWLFHSNWAVNVEAPSLPHTGKSLVISPQGELVLEAPARQAGILIAWERSLDRAWVATSRTERDVAEK